MGKQTKLSREAKGRECQIRIPGVCNGNPETTVPAHLNGGGWAYKRSDLCIAWACSSCHAVVDGAKSQYDRQTLELWHHEGVMRTLEILEDEGKVGWTG